MNYETFIKWNVIISHINHNHKFWYRHMHSIGWRSNHANLSLLCLIFRWFAAHRNRSALSGCHRRCKVQNDTTKLWWHNEKSFFVASQQCRSLAILGVHCCWPAEQRLDDKQAQNRNPFVIHPTSFSIFVSCFYRNKNWLCCLLGWWCGIPQTKLASNRPVLMLLHSFSKRLWFPPSIPFWKINFERNSFVFYKVIQWAGCVTWKVWQRRRPVSLAHTHRQQ